jgi:hypothetical protein
MKSILLVAVCTVGLAQQPAREAERRGQVPPQGSPKVGLGHGDLGNRKDKTLHGILLDATCQDRTSLNLRTAPATAPAAAPAAAKTSQAGAISAKGVHVDSQTADRERADALAKQTADLRTRQQDANCAVTGATVSFAVLLDDGRLLNLDEGGNTLAGQAVQASPAGSAMLNGNAAPFKPGVTLLGRPERERVVVEKIVRLE